MNVHLALNKGVFNAGFNKLSLQSVVKNSSGKQEFYTDLIKTYHEEWTSGGKNKNRWYEYCFNRYTKKENFGQVEVSSFKMKAISNLAINHGGITALETGLALHPIYGLPYLPGTALKGLAAHYADAVLGERFEELRQGGADYVVLFGSQTSAGFVNFHDALLIPECTADALKLDVLTPHHSEYNKIVIAEGNESKYNDGFAPRDDDSPIPIPFLSVTGTFQIVLTCEGDADEAQKWLKLAKQILVWALKHEGIGAKTNVGYGRMELVVE
ncbi:type III-B CRISPR module RAMP protein Cmr6 [Saccharibacillus sacchari]|uniref:Type III-B CRISPR module RAMP protein Cmr6 n=1 Tax=Saccharibacillus sacchari TaxID=456493 RepID=A0ACC6PBZ7_9BACL